MSVDDKACTGCLAANAIVVSILSTMQLVDNVSDNHPSV